jgi:hypothetical protein
MSDSSSSRRGVDDRVKPGHDGRAPKPALRMSHQQLPLKSPIRGSYATGQQSESLRPDPISPPLGLLDYVDYGDTLLNP